MKKIIVIGLDGLEPTIVDQLLAAGELPNFDRLRTSGGYTRVATTTPAQTPVAWSTFATGTNPGGHGIFDFIRRDPRTYLPDLSLNRYEMRGAFLPPRVINQRRGTPVWEVLSSAGVASTIIRCPCTYPPDSLRGRMLSGMGVPDLRGGLGTPTFYSTAENLAPRESENVISLRIASNGSYQTHLIGPRQPRGRPDLKCEMTLWPDHNGGRVLLRSAGLPNELEVRQGQWSDWLRVSFRLGMLQTVAGLVRFHLVRLEPELELYASPINFDASAPLFPISEPASYVRELCDALGPFHTTGMVEDHTGLNNGRIGEQTFLDQCDLAWREREAMLLHELERFHDGLLYCLFDTPDRVQHMFWRFREPDHPANRNERMEPGFAHVIDDQYRRADAVIGAVLDHAGPDTAVIALSDHGFGSFRRGMHLNTWLREQGLLTLKAGVEPGEMARDFFEGVDWSRTRAYALGLGGIYLNVAGRESHGIVPPADTGGLTTQIAGALKGLVDPATGRVAVVSAMARDRVYSGPFAAESPDLMVNFARGYRVSWATSLGGVPQGIFEDNIKKWSGDHIIEPAQIPGVLFANRPFQPHGARLEDLAPTILDALGVPKPPVMEGSTLLS